MALLSEAKEGRRDGSYTFLFRNEDLGALISEVHATSIRSGNELERLVLEKHADIMSVADWERFSEGDFIDPRGRFIVPPSVISSHVKKEIGSSHHPDIIVLIVVDKKAYVIELKLGDTVDTKKADGEMDHLRSFAGRFQARFTDYKVEPRLCCFYADTREQIVDGWKRRVKKSEAMTGREFCRLIGISHDNIKKKQELSAKKNLRHFVERLMDIDVVRELISEEGQRQGGL